MMDIHRIMQAMIRHEIVQISAILCLVVGALFWKVIFQGYVLLPADIVFSDPAWRDVAPERYRIAQNHLLSDVIVQFYPFHHLAAESMKLYHRVPLWNPYIFTGQPLVANMQSALFYPPNLLFFWLSPEVVAGIRAIYNLLFAGVFMFLFCRRLMVSKSGAILAAVCCTLSGPLIVWLGWPHANVLVCLPFLLWAGEGLLSGRQLCLWSLVVGTGVALLIVGGHPETAFHVIIVFCSYFLARLWFGRTNGARKSRILSGFLFATILGLMLSSIQWMPFIDFLRDSSTFASGRARITGEDSLLFSPSWKRHLLTGFSLLCPNIFGSPLSRYWFPLPCNDWLTCIYQNYNEQTAYFGLVPLVLAVGGLFSSKRKQSITILAILALFSLGIAWRAPGFEIFNHLPLFSIADNTRLKMLFSLLGCVLAGYGFDQVKLFITSRGRENRGICRVMAFAVVLALLFFGIIALGKLLLFPSSSLAVRFRLDPSHPLRRFLFRNFSFHELKTSISLASLLCAITAGILLWKGFWRSWFDGILIGIVLAELFVLAWGYNPMVEKGAVFPSTFLTAMLQGESQPFRIMSDGAFYPNTGCVYQIAHVDGYDIPVFQGFSELYRAQGGWPADWQQRWSPYWPLVDWLNVRYILTRKELFSPKFTLVAAGSLVKVYRNEAALPRAYMVYEAEIIKDDKRVLQKLISGLFDFKRRTILSSDLSPAQLEQMRRVSQGQQQSAVQFVNYSTDRVMLHVTTSSPGLLVMNDMYAPGWKVQVDGKESLVLRANYTFRAVFIPEGEHEVTFYYQPLSFQIGRMLSFLGLYVLIVCSSWLYLRKTQV